MENKTLLVFSEKNNSKKIYLVKDEVSHFYVLSGRSKNKSDLKIVMKNNQ